MNLTTLTHRDALCLNVRFTSREEAIHALTQRLAALGKISSTEQFLEEVYCRESLGPTALGEGLAVPHGKTAAVKKRRCGRHTQRAASVGRRGWPGSG